MKKNILAALTGGDLEYPYEGELTFSHLSEHYFLFFNLDRHVFLNGEFLYMPFTTFHP